MMVRISGIVESIRGRDSGRLYMVLKSEDGFLSLADGRCKKLANPKRKREKHTQYVGESNAPAAEKLREGGHVTDSELRTALKEYRELLCESEGGIQACQRKT